MRYIAHGVQEMGQLLRAIRSATQAGKSFTSVLCLAGLIVVTATAIFAGTHIQSTNGYYHNDRASTEFPVVTARKSPT
jgi:hypothetical protein